jgi:hypothetical protein
VAVAGEEEIGEKNKMGRDVLGETLIIEYSLPVIEARGQKQ